MAWTTPITWTTNQTVTAAQLNANIRDNLLETAPAKAATQGGYFVTSSPNTIVERLSVQAFDGAGDTTTSTTFADLSGGASPAATATTGAKAIVLLMASVSNSAVNGLSVMGVEVSGATTTAASDSASLRFTSATASANLTGSAAMAYTLNPGSNTFTAKYRVSAGTGTFGSRRINVLPF